MKGITNLTNNSMALIKFRPKSSMTLTHMLLNFQYFSIYLREIEMKYNLME